MSGPAKITAGIVLCMTDQSATTEVWDELRLSTSRTMRVVYALVGFVFLGVGILGWIVPGIPGTVNLLIALFFFSRSSDRMYRWMLTNRYFGQSLQDYASGLGIRRRIKVIAVASIFVAVTLSVVYAIDALWWKVGLIALGLYGIWFALTRPTREVELARRAALPS